MAISQNHCFSGNPLVIINYVFIKAKIAYDSALTAVIRSNETYHRFRLYYNASRDILDDLKKDFEAGLKEKEGWDIARVR